MASYTPEWAKHATLVASTVDTVTLTGTGFAGVYVKNRSGSGTIYFTINGATPTVAGDDTFVVAAGETYDSREGESRPAAGGTGGRMFVKLISSTADDYSVIGIR